MSKFPFFLNTLRIFFFHLGLNGGKMSFSYYTCHQEIRTFSYENNCYLGNCKVFHFESPRQEREHQHGK